MHREDYDFETTPFDEQCAQLGTPNYEKNSRLEASAVIGQVVRMHGEPPAGSSLRTKSNPHDFGSYLSVQFRWNPENEAHNEYFEKIESGWPSEWDDQAKAQLKAEGYSLTLN